MKRFFHCILIVLVAIFICCCGRDPHYKIGISQCSDDDWRQKMNAEIEREMMFYPNISYEIRSADDSNDRQISDIRYFIDNNFDLIIAAPNEADAITPVIDEAMAAGIPVVLFDRRVHGENFTAWLGADNKNIGRSAAQYIQKLVGTGAPVIEIGGLAGSTPAQGRHEGFNSVNLNVVGYAPGNWNYETAKRVADSLLHIHPDARAIFAHNDRMAIAASDVARHRGLSPYIIGVDGAPNIGVQAVADSTIRATFLYPTEGASIVNTALSILDGKPFERIRSFPASSAIDQSNVDIVMLQDKSLNDEIGRMHRLKTQVDEYWTRHSSQTLTLYAIIAVVVLLSVLIFLLLRAFWQHRRHQEALMIKNRQLEEERDKQKMLMEERDAATTSKLMFFTNVSHDLRTPLTLIAEPVEQLSHASNLTPQQASLMKIADKNVKLLQRLINHILDFRKYENGRLELRLTEIDLRTIIDEWSEAFRPMALRRDIKFSTVFDDGADYRLAIDVPKFESIFYNLVSNAFKYTPDNGTITLHAHCDGSQFSLSVEDSGQGIPKDVLPLIFDRFFRVDQVNPNGSGIGLAIAKAFSEIHEGSISVVSVEGKGSVFTVTIPVRHVAETIETKPVSSITSNVVDAELSDIEPADSHEDMLTDDNTLPLVLAIDDNADILAMLSRLLSKKFRVITASNGTEGLHMAAKYVPDLVICDVMMPGMDGLECCRLIKEEMSTSHIPVLMLTACALDEQRAQGYDSGADAYLPKPFNSAVLLSRIRNLIENRKRIRNISGEVQADIPKNSAKQSLKASVEGSPDIDNEFYQRFITLVNDRLSDPEMNVDAIASELGLGRSQFYRKIKSLTNYSPVELLRRIRLSRARTLLTRTEQSISEIAYAVGFSTPAYFTKCYREAFGETPSELRDRLSAR